MNFDNYMIVKSFLVMAAMAGSPTLPEDWTERVKWGISNPVTYGFYNKTGNVLKTGTIRTFNPLSGIFHQQANSPNAKVAVFSMSKVLTGFITLMTIEIFESIKVSNYFNINTNVLDFASDPKPDVHITVGECLTHMGGMPHNFYTYGISNWHNHIDQEKIGIFDYGSGFDVVGYILPQVWSKSNVLMNGQPTTWKKLNDIAKNLLFDPLGMKNSEFHGFDTAFFKTSYMKQAGGASLFTSLNDFSKFVVMLLNKGNMNLDLTFQLDSSKFHMKRYLSEDHFHEWVLTNRLPHGKPSGKFGDNILSDMSFGHSYISAISHKTQKSIMVKNFGSVRKYVTLETGKEMNTIYWRGLAGSAWQIDYEKGIAFVKISRNLGAKEVKIRLVWNSMAKKQKVELYGHSREKPSSGLIQIVETGNVADMIDKLGLHQENPGHSRKKILKAKDFTLI